MNSVSTSESELKDGPSERSTVEITKRSRVDAGGEWDLEMVGRLLWLPNASDGLPGLTKGQLFSEKFKPTKKGERLVEVVPLLSGLVISRSVIH